MLGCKSTSEVKMQWLFRALTRKQSVKGRPGNGWPSTTWDLILFAHRFCWHWAKLPFCAPFCSFVDHYSLGKKEAEWRSNFAVPFILRQERTSGIFVWFSVVATSSCEQSLSQNVVQVWESCLIRTGQQRTPHIFSQSKAHSWKYSKFLI